ncbi:dephospho-CoA kinase [Candidatus Saccharibacteria bacterium 47-87]|jgi:dephospho-CoA kinase|nr:AAA family ATPase [Candidatus Saccharibacteria bacterium]OJU96640.1 MAG: dephospho-CoA kinase [Candidatus Saccharibacteria bacterium 47-87]
MTHRNNLKILAFVGLTGAGKSTAVDHFTEKGYPKVYFGGVILDAMTEAGLEHTQENEKPFREEFRKKYGKDAVANKIVEQINHLADAGQHRIIADGLYSWTEYKVLRAAFPGELELVAIVAPRQLRYHRLSQRPVRPLTSSEAYARDIAEIENIEKGGPIAIADHFVINTGSIEHFNEQLEAVGQELDFA